MTAQTGNIICELNERATAHARQGASVDDAIRQAVTDCVGRLRGVGYRILSHEEIEQHSRSKFFEPYGERLAGM